MKKKGIILLIIVITIIAPLSAAIDKVSIGATYAMETITRGDSGVEEKINSAGMIVNGSSFFSPLSDVGIKYWLGVRKIVDWQDGATKVDVTNTPPYVDAGAAFVYQAPVNLDIFIEVGAGFQYSILSKEALGITVSLGTFYANAFAEFSYAFNDSLFLTAGVLAGYPLYVDGEIKIGAKSWTGQDSAKGLYLAPYAGISFAY